MIKRFQNYSYSPINSFSFFVNQAIYNIKYSTKKPKEFPRHDKEFSKLFKKNPTKRIKNQKFKLPVGVTELVVESK